MRVSRSHLVSSPQSHIWQSWADRLHRWGAGEFAASFLEAARPVNFVTAQLVYMSQPVLSAFLPPEHLTVLADTLEDPQETQAFLRVLRRASQKDPA